MLTHIQIDRRTRYAFCYQSKWKTDAERDAFRHLVAAIKAQPHPGSSFPARYPHYVSNDPAALELAKDGIDALIVRTGERIIREDGHEFQFNCCPQCGSVARTPNG